MKRDKKEKLIKQKWRRNAADRGDERQWRGEGGVPDCFFREQWGVLHESGASTQLGETRPTDPVAPRVVSVASARANVTPLTFERRHISERFMAARVSAGVQTVEASCPPPPA